MKKRIYNLIAASMILLFAASCEQDSATEMTGDAGTGGSLARFTVANDHLYTVDETNLKVYDLAMQEKPVFKDDKYVGFGIETIFPRGNTLFMGTRTGMFIYDINEPENPKQLSFYSHVYACDPVVADEDYAYVTLSSSNINCWRAVDELQIIDITDLSKPKLVKDYEMTSPMGLAINNDTLYVCDDGLKVLDVADKENVQQLHHFSNIQATDVIYNDGKLLVIGDNGFVQYRIENDTIIKISEIPVGG